MTFIVADRVKESSTTTGTSTYALAGAAANFQAFSAVCANSDTVYYVAVDRAGAGWEVGLGTWSTGNNLARTTILASSNAGSAVSWAAGTRDIMLTLPAERGVGLGTVVTSAAGTVQGDATLITGLVTVLTTVAASTGVRLPTLSSNVDRRVVHYGANDLKVYPPSGGTINGGSTNAAVTLVANQSVLFVTADGAAWYAA